MSMQVTAKMMIRKPVHEVFEAFVDPAKISQFWWSSSSGRWEQGKTITLRYEEYNAEVEVAITEVQVDKRIVFKWVAPGQEQIVTITLDPLDTATSTIEVTQHGWREDEEALVQKLLDNKEGWVYVLTCLKGYLEFGVNGLRAGLVK